MSREYYGVYHVLPTTCRALRAEPGNLNSGNGQAHFRVCGFSFLCKKPLMGLRRSPKYSFHSQMTCQLTPEAYLLFKLSRTASHTLKVLIWILGFVPPEDLVATAPVGHLDFGGAEHWDSVTPLSSRIQLRD